MELKPQLQQKQTISPKMMQSVQILQMGMQELEAYITDIALENPLIELEGTIPQKSAETGEDALARKTEWLMATDSQNRVYYETDREEDGFYERAQGDPAKELESYLMVQLLSHCQTEREKQIFYYMVQSLDSRGYMDEELGGLAERFGLLETECEAYLSCLQSCDPAGIGARDLKECLLLQLERYPGSGELARRLVTEYLDWVGKRRFSQIAAKLGCSPELVQKAVKQIQKLNPIPGNGFSKRENLKYIYPDVIVVRFEGYYEILLNESQSHRMHINSYYVDILKDEQADAETKKYIKSKLEQVNWAVHCIEQRNATLHRVAAAIVTWQKLFLNGA